MAEKSPGQLAYESYSKQHKGRSPHDGSKLKKWKYLNPAIQKQWELAVEKRNNFAAVIEEHRSSSN